MIWLVLGLVVFLGIHSVRMVAPGFRERVIASRGEGVWKGVYSVAAIAGFILLVWGYGQARLDTVLLYEPPVWMKHVASLLMLFSFIFLVASQLPAGRIKQALKHPMLVAVKTWALAHLLANGDLASLILFLAFLGWAVWNRIAVKRRGDPVFGTVSVRNDIIAVVAGVALTLWFIFQLHGWLIGVPLAT
ncbi:NnrU family protein [Oricola cellulosilytica]|uniref:NnrU family protein n=1 Tax=Oricola cellulosilytica TaxID=1429082 RepID=A0A4R0P8L4_9HYPH|nr:NnrU family protein [Oricola cellulosilytica]TCD13414.1 NnrU family protein [Oricola cellulosilytica]